jgi:putative NIF3 family GTP cyclohydrolase 1 type 2
MEEIAPPHLAEPWDNVGLLVGSGRILFKKIMVTLDVTADVIKGSSRKKLI